MTILRISQLIAGWFKAEEIRTLRDQITSNLERAWEITGGTEDQLTGMMVQISQGWAKQFKESR